MINLHGDQIKYQANINKTMRIDKKQKKKEIVLKIIVTFGLVNFNRSNHYEQQDKKIFPSGRRNSTLLV